MNLLTVIPFCQADAELAKRLVSWIVELDNANPRAEHSCLIAYDSAVPLDTAKEIVVEARKYFRYVMPLAVRVDATEWPKAPNLMFHNVAQFVKDTFKFPFLWMEPDSVPLRRDWVDELAKEYYNCPTKYMGALIKSEQTGLPPVHLAGCAVYPNDAIDLMKPFCDDKATLAWDMGSASAVAGSAKATNTKLIFHYWGQKDLAPTFVTKKEADKEYPINTMELARIPESACFYHRCKDGSLITALKEQRKAIAERPFLTEKSPQMALKK